MTDDTSPENLRKFLVNDDPAMRRMGLSMAKGGGVPDELYKNVFGLEVGKPPIASRFPIPMSLGVSMVPRMG